mmetsp:Transcript_21877/g.62245  ORF Transcript_21877/g.62245 Transcript_21877/m.62245 type:complete len:379 (-) Transcript_21877:133-1269(-)
MRRTGPRLPSAREDTLLRIPGLDCFVVPQPLSSRRRLDILTFTFGDAVTHGRLYLRGQFAMHRLSAATSRLWLACEFLSASGGSGGGAGGGGGSGGLLHELRIKHARATRAQQRGEAFRPHFNSAEGCYSRVVATSPTLRVKYANRMIADFTSAPQVYVLLSGGGRRAAVRMCAGSEGDGTAGGLVGSPMRPTASSSAPASQRAACDPFAPPPPPPRASLLGNQRPVGALIPLVTHTNCSEWVEPRYRVCADVSGAWASELGADGAANGWNFFYLAGRWYRQRFTASHPAGLIEGALFHFQVWKRAYKRQGPQLAPIPPPGESAAFVLTKEGYRPLALRPAGGSSTGAGTGAYEYDEALASIDARLKAIERDGDHQPG